MTNITRSLLDTIEQRRDELIEQARAITAPWFESDRYKVKTRFYAPFVRTKMTGDKTTLLSVSIIWSRRHVVEGWQGKVMRRGKNGPTAMRKITCTYIAQRRSGAAYPPAMFPDANETELADILEAEAVLAPIRAELKWLGNLRKSIHAYNRMALRNEAKP